jgi:DNA-binding HxlR family transcriptional regulator
MTNAAKIKETIQNIPLGEPFLSTQLLTFGSRNCIDQTLYRFEKQGLISRVARGIYIRPKQNRIIGLVLPSPFQVAEKLAELTGEVVQVNGAEAARLLGLSTQVSVKPIYWTSGPNRKFHMRNQKVILKHVAARKIAHAGSIVGLAITALWYLGKKGVTVEILQQIKKQMTTEQYQQFMGAINIMPTWLVNLLQKLENNNEQ